MEKRYKKPRLFRKTNKGKSLFIGLTLVLVLLLSLVSCSQPSEEPENFEGLGLYQQVEEASDVKDLEPEILVEDLEDERPSLPPEPRLEEKLLEEEEVEAEEEIQREETQEVDESPGNIEVHFIDVGQGDASLLICDGKTMLIDGGKASESSLIYSYLRDRGIDHLDYIVNSHPHEDHVGGLSGALNYASADKALVYMTDYDSRAFSSFLKYLDQQSVPLTVVSAGDKFKLGSADVEILGPVYFSSEVNNNSIVMKVSLGDISFLYTGDAQREEEIDILTQGYDLSSTVLKVGHHGSDTSTTYPFLREILPDFAVISAGKNNQYGHPTENTLSRLRDADARVLRTDMQGHIVFTSDGKEISYEVERNRDADPFKNPPPATPKTEPEEEPETEGDVRYILNTRSKKFHHPTCHSVEQMAPHNKQETNKSREEVIGMGYSPCGNCKP